MTPLRISGTRASPGAQLELGSLKLPSSLESTSTEVSANRSQNKTSLDSVHHFTGDHREFFLIGLISEHHPFSGFDSGDMLTEV